MSNQLFDAYFTTNTKRFGNVIIRAKLQPEHFIQFLRL